MAEGRGKAEWSQTSLLAAVIANCHRNPKKPALKPADFNPYLRAASAKRAPKLKVGIDALRQVFVPEVPAT